MTMAAAMPFAAMITLSHRLPILFGAVADSNVWRDPEFLRMTNEKVQAAGQTAAALGGAVAASQQAIAGYALTQTSANLALLMAPPRASTELQSFAGGSLRRLSDLAQTLGEIGGKAVASGLRPNHSKVTANARRLTNKRR